MAKLTKNETLHVAHLAKLDIKESEIDKFKDQLSKVLDHISELESIDTKDTTPTAQTTNLKNVFRPDETKIDNVLSQDEALSGKDDTKNGFFVVPQIIEK